MKTFGNLTYQEDIHGKALVDYAKWIFFNSENMDDLISLFFSHEAMEIYSYLPVKEEVNKAEKSLKPFLKDYRALNSALMGKLELTDREVLLMGCIIEFKECEDDYAWNTYVKDFKEYHDILLSISETDQKFIDFWIA